MRGVRVRRAAAIGLLAGLFAHGPDTAARADGDVFAALTAADATPSGVADQVAAVAASHSFGEFATVKGALTLVMPGTDAERVRTMSRLNESLAKSLAALRELGLPAPDEAPRLTIVQVHAKAGAPFAVWASGGAPVLAIRDVDGFRPADPPGPPARTDGPPLLRDAVESSRRGRLWIDEREVTTGFRLGGPGSVAFELARHAARASIAAGRAPDWLFDGLAGWVESKVAKPRDAHICRPYAAAKADMLLKLIDDTVPRPASATRFLARIVGVLVDGRTDLPARIEAMHAADGLPDKTLETAFGIAAADLMTKACAGLKPSECACDDAITIACPVCKGTGRIQLDCPDCEGSGYNVCPTCRGSDVCPTNCIGGVFFIGLDEVKCKVCVKGKVHCAACGNTQRIPCKACGGKKATSYPCLVCAEGRLPCPDAGVAAPDVAPGTPCTWCRDPARKFACPECGGAGYLGCGACFGTLKIPCSRCGGAGETPDVIQSIYGPLITGRTCTSCGGAGFAKCTLCASGKRKCATCGGKGLALKHPDDCPACVDGVLPLRSELARVRVLASSPLDAIESAAAGQSTKRAIDFLLSSRNSSGLFCLRANRAEGQKQAGDLEESNTFSNALVLWGLALGGVDPTDRRVVNAWAALRRQAAKTAEETGFDARTQETSFALRALVLGREDPKGPLVSAIVDKICKAQRSSGWWGGWLDAKSSYDDVFDSLIVVESLRMARLKGAKVPREVWEKVLRAASSTFDSKGPKTLRSEILGATDVLSNLALVVMAKEATLGAKATSFDYTSLTAVKGGLAWLDRHFDIRRVPAFVKGSPIRSSSDSGYAAYLFAVQRLAVLLNIEVLAGDNWHAGGFRHLLPMQYEDGSFEERTPGHGNGPVRTTVACVLFLLRATSPITDVKDD